MTASGPESPRVTIVVTQRERFGLSARSLDSVYSHTDVPFSLVYVDAGSPSSVRSLLDEEATRRGFKLLRLDRYVPPNVARDLALEHVDTELVAFIDNDLLVSPGWLKALIDCLDETGASAAGPVYLEGKPGEETVHMAGGWITIEEQDGKRILDDSHDHYHADAATLLEELERKPVDFLEYHCMLTRTDQLREIGGLDRRLLSLHEHIDLCMMLRKVKGGSIMLEPKSVVTYVPPPPLDPGDFRIFVRRWSERWAHDTLTHFGSKWNVEVSRGPRDFNRGHRQIAFEPLIQKISRLFGKKERPRLVVWLRRLEAATNWLIVPRGPDLYPERRGRVRVVAR